MSDTTTAPLRSSDKMKEPAPSTSSSRRLLDKACLQEKWIYNYERLVVFHSLFSHTRVPDNYPLSNPTLAKWVKEQRKRESSLTEEQRMMLNKLGFEWNYLKRSNMTWMQKFKALEKFKQKNGDCYVPQGYTADQSLGGWVTTQRVTKKNGTISKEREKMLNDIGFSWSLYDQRTWMEQFCALSDFKKCNGHCLVPQNYKTGSSLGVWVKIQRKNKLNDTLEEDQVELLDSLDFEWVV
mmetsp:Transcript_23677/g.33937  ORF Transcript_23677/g.33937 Transcript_23677/m.33937 type:complete len:238 (+) Transcript_23677:113-826(+)